MIEETEVRKDNVADEKATVAPNETQEVKLDVNAYLKWQKDVNRQMQGFRTFFEKFQATSQEETKGNQGIQKGEIDSAVRYARLVGSLPEDIQAEFDEMEGSYAEKIRAVQFYLKGRKTAEAAKEHVDQKVDAEKEEAPEPVKKKVVHASPEAPAGSKGVPVFRTIKDFNRASKEDRARWRAAGNSPSVLPER